MKTQGGRDTVIATVSDYLDDRKALYQERGLQWVWNELKALANTALAGYTGTIGAANLVTDMTPDVAELGDSTGKYDLNGDLVRDGMTGFRS